MSSVRANLIATVACALGACSVEARQPGPPHGVLLIVIDGLRADHVGCYGYDRDTTPELDAFASKGVIFEQAFSTAPWFFPAHVSLMTGCDPLVAKRILPPDILPSLVTLWHVPESVPHLAQEFLRQGYDTAAFVDQVQVAPVHGFARGFENFFAYEPEEREKPEDRGVLGATQRLKHWLAARSAGANWFAYVQISDLERVWSESDAAWDTYFAPRPELAWVPPVADAPRTFFAIPRQRWSGGMRTLGEYEAEYDGAIRRVDQALGRWLHEFEAGGQLEHTTVVITSSHGVGFGEAGLFLDAGTLTDVDLHVPLIVRPAQGLACARGSRSPVVASSIDVAPTLLALSRLSAPREMQGVSLARALAGALDDSKRTVFALCGYQEGFVAIDERYCFEVTSPWKAEDRTLAASWFGGPIDTTLREVLHDRRADPSPSHTTSAPLDENIVAPMRAAAADWEARIEQIRKRIHEPDWIERIQTPDTTAPKKSGS